LIIISLFWTNKSKLLL